MACAYMLSEQVLDLIMMQFAVLVFKVQLIHNSELSAQGSQADMHAGYAPIARYAGVR